MSIPRSKTGGFSLGEKLTRTIINAIDLATTWALDKRSGQTDTLESIVSCAGAGRIIPSFVAGTDANTSYTAGGGNQVINASSGLTAPRNYTLSTTGAIAGDRIAVIGGAQDVTVIDGFSTTTIIVVGTTNTGNNHAAVGDFVFTGTRWICASSLSPILQRQIFTVNGSYTVPAGIYRLLVVGCGGGGGGGGGSGGNNSTSASANGVGGGGGGAALFGCHQVNTTPAASISVTIGTGGGGGTGGTSNNSTNQGNDGSDGASTTFGAILTFLGGGGGKGGLMSTGGTATFENYSPGGAPVAGGVKPPNIITTAAGAGFPLGVRLPGEGGYGGGGGASATGPRTGSSGNRCHVSGTTGGSGTTTAGTGGAKGGTGSAGIEGGGGGGGGASAFGNGGNGGAGGTAGTAAPGSAGSNGSAGTVGSGGGGGGAAGGGTGGTPTGGTGGAGGDGVLVVIPIR